MDTSLIINATTTAGKKAAKAISNINPDKDNTILKTFAQKVNALTTNTYVDATRVNKMSVNEEGGGSTTTLTVNDTELPTKEGLDYHGYVTIEGGVRFTFADYPMGNNTYNVDVTIG